MSECKIGKETGADNKRKTDNSGMWALVQPNI